MDKAPDFKSGDSRFESWQGRSILVFLLALTFVCLILVTPLANISAFFQSTENAQLLSLMRSLQDHQTIKLS